MATHLPARATLRRSLPVLGAFVVGALAYGPLYCFPPISQAFATEFHATKTLAVTPWTMFLLVSALSSPLLGRAYDVFADRTLLSMGVFLLGAGWLVASWASDVSLLIVAYGVFLALGLQLVFVGTSTAVARRYAGVAGLALGIAYAGPGIGVAVILPVVTPLVPAAGWREVLLAFALLSLAALPFVVLMTSGQPVLVAARPAEPARARGRAEAGSGLHETSGPGAIAASLEPLPSASRTGPSTATRVGPASGSRTPAEGLRRVLRTRRFLILLFGAVGIGCIDEGVYQLFQPHAALQGIGSDFAAQALALQSVSYVVGQVAGGALSDRFGRRYVGLIVAVLVFVGTTFAWTATGSTEALALAGNALYGFGIGSTIAIRSAAFSDVFGGRNFGAIFGIIAMAYPAGGILVMYGGAIAFDRLGNYWAVYAIAMASLAIWSAALLVAGPRRHGLHARMASVRARLSG